MTARSERRHADDVSAERLPEELKQYLQTDPIAYTGFRILHIYTLRGDDAIAERDEVPFVGRVLFPVIFGGYLLFRRLIHLLSGLVGDAPNRSLPQEGHLFTMTSTHEFRTHAFINVAAELEERGFPVRLLCSPAAAGQRKDWEERGLSTVTFEELLGHVRVHRFPGFVLHAIRARRRLDELGPYEAEAAPISLTVNLMVLEQVKRECIQDITREDPAIHTYSPTPYVLESTSLDRIYVYQHGIQWHRQEKQTFDWAVPAFVPLTYIVWGKPWISNFERYAHPDARVLPLGSPWYDHLAEQDLGTTSERSWDVLFVSSSPHSDAVPEEHDLYHDLFEMVRKTCEANDLSLAVKLHPNESPEWYYDRGWDEYIVEFTGIEEALSSASVAVTDNSSAFVESTVLGTPMVVADINHIGLETLGPVSNVVFADDLDELRGGIVDLRTVGSDPGCAERRLVRIGGATERIADEVEVNADS